MNGFRSGARFSGHFKSSFHRNFRNFSNNASNNARANFINASRQPIHHEIAYIRSLYLQGRFYSGPVTTTTSTSIISTELTAPQSAATSEAESSAIAESQGSPVGTTANAVSETLSRMTTSSNRNDVTMQLQHKLCDDGDVKLDLGNVKPLVMASPNELTATTNVTAAASETVSTQAPLLDTLTTTATVGATATAATFLAVEQMGDLKAMGICKGMVVGPLEQFMEAIYVTTGLPWWGTIVATTGIIRIIFLPLAIRAMRISTKMNMFRPEMDAMKAKISALKEKGDTGAMQQEYMKLREFMGTNGLKPFSVMLWTVVQAVVFISFFWALQEMASLPVPGFTTEGLAWISDLTKGDPYYVFPLLSALGFLAVFELNILLGASAAVAPGVRSMMRAVMLLAIPFSSQLPSAVFVYWTTTNVLSLFQVVLLNHPVCRRLLNIPVLSSKFLNNPGTAAASKVGVLDAWKMIKEAAKRRAKIRGE